MDDVNLRERANIKASNTIQSRFRAMFDASWCF